MLSEIYTGFFFTLGGVIIIIPSYIILSKYQVNQGQILVKKFSNQFTNLFFQQQQQQPLKNS